VDTDRTPAIDVAGEADAPPQQTPPGNPLIFVFASLNYFVSWSFDLAVSGFLSSYLLMLLVAPSIEEP